MIKMASNSVTFAEVPDEISLYITISNCPVHCPDCNSKWLWKNEGEELNIETLQGLINRHKGITCICFGGGESDPASLLSLMQWIKENTNLKLCWYTGRNAVTIDAILTYCDYIKKGPFIKKYGPLNCKTTNQRFYKKEGNDWVDITYKFYNKEEQLCKIN